MTGHTFPQCFERDEAPPKRDGLSPDRVTTVATKRVDEGRQQVVVVATHEPHCGRSRCPRGQDVKAALDFESNALEESQRDVALARGEVQM